MENQVLKAIDTLMLHPIYKARGIKRTELRQYFFTSDTNDITEIEATLMEKYYATNPHKLLVIRDGVMLHTDIEDTIRRIGVAEINLSLIKADLQPLVDLRIITGLENQIYHHDVFSGLPDKVFVEVLGSESDPYGVRFKHEGRNVVITKDHISRFNRLQNRLKRLNSLCEGEGSTPKHVTIDSPEISLDPKYHNSHLLTVLVLDVTDDRSFLVHATRYLDSICLKYGLELGFLATSNEVLKMQVILNPDNLVEVYNYITQNSLVNMDWCGTAKDKKFLDSMVKVSVRDLSSRNKTFERLYTYL